MHSSPRVLRALLLLFAALVATALALGPLASGNATPKKIDYRGYLIYVESGTEPSVLVELVARLKRQGVRKIVDLTGLIDAPQNTPSLLRPELAQEELGILADWDGVHRRIDAKGETLFGSLAKFGNWPKSPNYRVPVLDPQIPAVHLEHVARLDSGELAVERTVIAQEESWHTQRFRTPSGQQSLAQIAASMFLGAPPSSSPQPYLFVWLFFLASVYPAIGYRVPSHHRLLFWASPALGVAATLAFGQATLALAVGWLILVSGLKILDSLYAKASVELESELQTVEPPPPASLEKAWSDLCESATSQYGALAAWVFVKQAGSWLEVSRSGDAFALEPSQVERLRAPPSTRQPEDKAFLSLPVPSAHSPIGLLILQPGDGETQDPVRALGGAMRQLTEVKDLQGLSPGPAKLRHMQKVLALLAHTNDSMGCLGVYDALGQPVWFSKDLISQMAPSFSTTDTIHEAWKRLGGDSRDFRVLLSASNEPFVTARESRILLNAVVHAGTVECYTIRVVNAAKRTEERPR